MVNIEQMDYKLQKFEKNQGCIIFSPIDLFIDPSVYAILIYFYGYRKI